MSAEQDYERSLTVSDRVMLYFMFIECGIDTILPDTEKTRLQVEHKTEGTEP